MKSRPSVIGFLLFVQRTCDDDDDDGQLLHSSCFAFTAYMATAAHDKDSVADWSECVKGVCVYCSAFNRLVALMLLQLCDAAYMCYCHNKMGMLQPLQAGMATDKAYTRKLEAKLSASRNISDLHARCSQYKLKLRELAQELEEAESRTASVQELADMRSDEVGSACACFDSFCGRYFVCCFLPGSVCILFFSQLV